MITTLVAAFLFQNSAPINHEYCGLLLEPQAKQIVMDRQNAGLYQPNASLLGTEQLVITVAWHVLINGAAEGQPPEVAIDEPTLADMLDAMNDAFAPANISFAAMPGMNYISPESFDETWPEISNVDRFRSTNVLPNALNIYWAPQLSGLCGISAFTFSSGPPTIAMASGPCAGWPDVTGVLVHEVGHWFDLFHTFETFYGEECVSGSNCNDAGDLVCDTPASFGLEFGSCVNPDTCNLRASCSNEPGPCAGDEDYNPSTTNYMSYSYPRCLTEFSQLQYERIRATAENFRTDYLNTFLHVTCPGDINVDGAVNFSDLQFVLSGWGICAGECPADLNQDLEVNFSDLQIILSGWGNCNSCLANGDCDDGDPSTLDMCIFGVCYNDPVPECPAGEIKDCNGNCAPADWLGDGLCDDGAYAHNGVPIDFNCEEFNADEGDCGP